MLQKGIAALGARLARRGARTTAAPSRPPTHVRIPPYSPEMANEADAIEAMQKVLGEDGPEPLAQAVCRIREVPTRFDDTDTAGSFTATPRGTGALAPGISPGCAGKVRIETLFSAARLGSDAAHEVHLSSRQAARVDSDPFVKRLTRLD